MNTRLHELGFDLSFHPAVPHAAGKFTPEQIADYNRDGYITDIILFEGERLREIQKFFDEESASVMTGSGFRSYHHEVPELYDLVTDPRLVEYLRDLLGPNIVCFVSQYICKQPGDVREVVWHQDAAYNPMDAKSVVVWLAVHDAFTDNGCMNFIPGSHRQGLVDFKSRGRDENSLGGREIDSSSLEGNTIPIELKAGQAVFFSDLLMHSSPGNFSKNSPRGGFTMTFASAEVAVKTDETFNVSNREAVLSSGTDVDGNWNPHPRPERSQV